MCEAKITKLVQLAETQDVDNFIEAFNSFYLKVTETLQQFHQEAELLRELAEQPQPTDHPRLHPHNAITDPKPNYLRLIGRSMAALDFPLVLDGLYTKLLQEKSIGLKTILRILNLFHLSAPHSKSIHRAIGASLMIQRCFSYIRRAINIVKGGEGVNSDTFRRKLESECEDGEMEDDSGCSSDGVRITCPNFVSPKNVS